QSGLVRAEPGTAEPGAAEAGLAEARLARLSDRGPEAGLATVHKRPTGARLDQIRPGGAETRLAAAEREPGRTRCGGGEPRLATVPTAPAEPGLARRRRPPGLARRRRPPGLARRPRPPGLARRRRPPGLARRRYRPGVHQIGAGRAEARLAAIGAEPVGRAEAGPDGRHRVRRRQPARFARP